MDLPVDSGLRHTVENARDTLTPQQRARLLRKIRREQGLEAHDHLRRLDPEAARLEEVSHGWTTGLVAFLVVALLGYAWFLPESPVAAAETLDADVLDAKGAAVIVRRELLHSAEQLEEAPYFMLRVAAKGGEVQVKGYREPLERWHVAASIEQGVWQFPCKGWTVQRLERGLDSGLESGPVPAD